MMRLSYMIEVFMEHLHTMPDDGFLRLKQVLRFIPVSKSKWWAGVNAGEYPAPVKLGPRTTAWHVDDIRKLISTLSGRKTVN